jgi:FSR family fosmidomycin resistance protein-like MFS transporter
VIAIIVLAAAHFLVDVSAGTVNPLWQGFEDHLEVRRGGLLWVYVGWSIATSFAQLFFAWWADRAPQRWLVWLGPLVGIVCVGLAGLAPSPWLLALLLVVGGLGIAAFHPEGAAAAGMAYPSRRSRMMAIFALCGYLGQSIGPYLSARLTTSFGLPVLVWIGAACVIVLAALWTLRAHVPSPPARTRPVASQQGERAGLGIWALLLAVGTLRIIPSIGVPLVIAYWLTDRGHIGVSQSAFMFGIGAGSILCAVCVGPGRERRVLWLLPIAAVPCLAAIPHVPQPLLAWIVGGTGFVLGIALPVFISFGQQMLPHHPRAASSITMGVSWGSAGMMAAGAVKLFTVYGSLPDLFYLFAASSLAAGLLSLRLPSLSASRTT